MLDESDKEAAGDLEASMLDMTEQNESSGVQPPELYTGPLSLKQHLRRSYGRRPVRLLKRYLCYASELAERSSYTIFLAMCHTMRIVPRDYRVECRCIHHNHQGDCVLNEYSYSLMLTDLGFNQVRRLELRRFMGNLREKLENILSPMDLNHVEDLADAKYANIFQEATCKQRGIFAELLEEYGLVPNEGDQ